MLYIVLKENNVGDGETVILYYVIEYTYILIIIEILC